MSLGARSEFVRSLSGARIRGALSIRCVFMRVRPGERTYAEPCHRRSRFPGSHLCTRLVEDGRLDGFQTGRVENVAHLLEGEHARSFELIRHDVVDPCFAEVDKIYHPRVSGVADSLSTQSCADAQDRSARHEEHASVT